MQDFYEFLVGEFLAEPADACVETAIQVIRAADDAVVGDQLVQGLAGEVRKAKPRSGLAVVMTLIEKTATTNRKK